MGIPFLLLSLALLFLSLPISSSSTSSSTLSEGSSLSVENLEDRLISPNGVFFAGFYSIGNNAYSFAIWFSKPSCNNNCTIVWMANRDFPVNGKHSKLLLKETGKLILTDADKSIVWSTDTNSLSSTELHLNDTGNLVLYDVIKGVVLWQSFDSPTDTLLPSQRLTRDMQLVSARSETNCSAGFYKLLFDNDNTLSLLYDGPDFSSVYWPFSWENGRFLYNSSRIASLDSSGMFASSDNYTFLSADYGSVSVQRRLTLDTDGNLRLYSWEEESTAWVVSWLAILQRCRIHGICGPNSTCVYDRVSGGKCTCLPGYQIKNHTDWSYGCEPQNSFLCGNCTDVRFIQLSHVEFYGNDYGYHPNYTIQMCQEVCRQLFSCKGFQYKLSKHSNYIGDCFPKTLLVSGQFSPSFEGDFYLKVPKTSPFPVNDTVPGFGFDCSGDQLLKPLNRPYTKSHENGTLRFMNWFAIALAGVEIIEILCVWCFLVKSQKQTIEATQGYHIMATGFKRYTYSELKRATRNFSEEIGRGAGGVVYKATLFDNRIAAIKKLDIAIQGEAEFLAEVNIIGKLNHMNLIDLWGYCVEGKHRLLVYEFMEHGSLAENLSSKELDWPKRFDITLGTARGLAYLHEECLEWVLHCDVKPQNILLDSNYQPKVSDFGLSKLLNRGGQNNSSFSRIRGTRGYMAPEWVCNLPITSKVDVYSYGIVVLEIVTGKSPSTMGIQAGQNSGDQTGHGRLVTWVREENERANNGAVSWIDEIIDPALEGEYDKAKMEMLVTLALQCVEEDPDARPSMVKVVETLLHYENI